LKDVYSKIKESKRTKKTHSCKLPKTKALTKAYKREFFFATQSRIFSSPAFVYFFFAIA
jgi:hypothetical protein